MVNIQQNKLKLRCTNLTQKAIHLHMETWIQVSFLLQKGYCFLQLRGSLPKCQRRCASGNVTECSSILLLLKAQSPLTVLVSVFKGKWKALLYSKVICLWTFRWSQYTLLSTERARLISHCVNAQEHKIVELLETRSKKAPLTSRTSFSLLLSDLPLLNFSARWEMLCLDFKNSF